LDYADYVFNIYLSDLIEYSSQAKKVKKFETITTILLLIFLLMHYYSRRPHNFIFISTFILLYTIVIYNQISEYKSL
jgi:uncharacterized membrane protein YfhO